MKQARFASEFAMTAGGRGGRAARPRARSGTAFGGCWSAKPAQFAGFAIVRCNPRFRLRSLRCLVALAAVVPAVARGQASRSLSSPCACRRSTRLFQYGGPRPGERLGIPQGEASRPRSARPPKPGSGRYPRGSSPRRGASSAPGRRGKRGARSLPSGHVSNGARSGGPRLVSRPGPFLLRNSHPTSMFATGKNHQVSGQHDRHAVPWTTR